MGQSHEPGSIRSEVILIMFIRIPENANASTTVDSSTYLGIFRFNALFFLYHALSSV